ncbi:hypothetical protein BZG35_16045 [Brevundimonas sp. LM2]|uniref:hypothetical protein n=1 Tax=Brevundimonas sp. LM2 TaxID=1938605 RepID=UPI000983F889|nr:hypothetical protein [Brevundimonas sp. LM2]AQR63001.1 hypothetical protein BZG35_16045 [Brevundimonas sp. LM2]
MDRLKAMTEAALEATVDDEAHRLLAGRLSLCFDAVTSWTLNHAADGTVTIGSAFQMAEHIAPYEEYYHKHDLWRQRSVLAPLDVAINCERLVSQAEMADSELYNDFIRPSGKNVFHCLGVMLTTPHGRELTGIGIQRVRSQPAFEEADERLLQAAQPYLSRMVRARWRMTLLGEKLAVAESVSASSPDAVLIVDRLATVVWRNPAAQTEAGMPFSREATGRLRLKGAEDDRALREAVAAATSRFPVGTSRAILGPDGTVGWRIAIDPFRGGGGRPLAILRIRDVQGHAARQAGAAATAFGLTSAERALALALLRGMTLEAHAHARGVRMTTARAHLRALLAKSATGRQAEFVAVAATLPS